VTVEIVIRAAVLFFFLWGVTRAVGRSTLGELSTFELLLYVTMGDLVQQAVTQQDYSVTGGILAVSVFAVLTVILNWTQWRFPRTRRVINGVPIVIVRDGEILGEATKSQRFSSSDLLATARQQGIRSIADVELAVLERDGRVSFFTRSDAEAGAPETGISS
jgi:uncharacterized membrane protein YcaP (DUF421 family)